MSRARAQLITAVLGGILSGFVGATLSELLCAHGWQAFVAFVVALAAAIIVGSIIGGLFATTWDEENHE